MDSLMRKKMLGVFGGVVLGVLVCTQAFGGEIVIFGDSQRNRAVQQKIVDDIVSWNPVAVFRVGDLVDNGNDPKLWQETREVNAPLLKPGAYFPALGNHEKNSPLYFEMFPELKGQRWYSVEREGIHVTVLDSNAPLGPGSEQYRWLEADLKAVSPKTRFRIAIFHHPLFAVSKHKQDEKALQPILLPLFKTYGVKAVFSGHDHNYERFEYNGSQFVVTGGGGSHLYPQMRTSPYLKTFRTVHHFCVLTPGEAALSVKVVDIDGQIVDEFLIDPVGR